MRHAGLHEAVADGLIAIETQSKPKRPEMCKADRPPLKPNGQIDRNTRCVATKKLIRVTDGYCNGCVPWKTGGGKK